MKRWQLKRGQPCRYQRSLFAKSSRDLKSGDSDAFFEHVANDVDWTAMGTQEHSTACKVSDREEDQAIVELHSLARAKNGMRFDNYYC
jgi:hypothetical protein